MKSIIRLFKALPVASKLKGSFDPDILNRTIRSGFILAPEVIANYSGEELERIIKDVEVEFGLSGQQANNAFHKSWDKVKNASIEQLVIEQIFHYITTYGFESAGGFDHNTVFIPAEKLDIPDLDVDNFTFINIKGYTVDELKVKLMALLESGIALGKDTIDDVVDVAVFVLSLEEVEQIQNHEVRIVLYDYFGYAPKDPVEFLRYLIYKATQNTLLIKGRATLGKIALYDKFEVVEDLFIKYEANMGLELLASVFFRFKPLFLAFRKTDVLKTKINKIRKLANKYHEPMPESYLNEVTAKLGRKEDLSLTDLNRALDNANTFRKVRLAYALKYRTKEVESILYKIRNGKGYATDFNFDNKRGANEVLNHVLGSISQDLRNNVEGKAVYIPEAVNYALPATEKQFTGMFPSGTSVKVDSDMVFGIWWKNIDGVRVDLDLSLIDLGGRKYGWNAYYRNEERSILFSGDMTDAPGPGGASELFYIKKQTNNNCLVALNHYNHHNDDCFEVPFKIFVGSQKIAGDIKHGYMIDPNNILASTTTKIKLPQMILGIVVTNENGSVFYFSESVMGGSRVIDASAHTQHSTDYLFNFFTDTINLKDVLVGAGAILTTKEDCEIDLSPENLEKDTIINLLKKAK